MTETKYQCSECEQLWDADELVTVYECSSCGERFDRDNSADGVSNRCPGCNKFAAKDTEEGCPEDYELCEAVEGEFDKDADTWVVVEPPTPPTPKVHYHLVFFYSETDITAFEKSAFQHETREHAENLIQWDPGHKIVKNDDGSFTEYEDPEHTIFRKTIRIIECTQNHKKGR